MQDAVVGDLRRYRDEVVHRERPKYRAQAAFGRTTLWDQGSFAISLPPRDPPPDEGVPTLEQRRRAVGRGVMETLGYAETLWTHTKRWLATLDVRITPLPNRTVEITTTVLPGPQTQRFPRANRDPGPFLHT